MKIQQERKPYKSVMPISCSFCKTVGNKGYFSFPKNRSKRMECLQIAGLPPEEELKVKISSLRICFRHYQESDFCFTNGGNKLRLKRGEFAKKFFYI